MNAMRPAPLARRPRTEHYVLRDGTGIALRYDGAIVSDAIEVDLGVGFRFSGLRVGDMPRGRGTDRAELEAVLSRFFFLNRFDAKSQAGWAHLTHYE